ncbi:MAG: glycosyltransferase family 2 protein [Flavobacterium sp.]
MLSILIPVYNYNVYPLVLELKQQADGLGINYEILVQDDLSQKFIIENTAINTLSNCGYAVNNQNLGRGKNINLLCSKCSYNYVLIMEADSFPESKSYVKNYVEALSKPTSIIFGGVNYSDSIPPKEKILRWRYGINRESKSLKHRLKNNYDFVFTWNLLLKRDLLLKYPFPEFINEYGYEDLVFIKNLKLNSIAIDHIENPLIHYNNEDNLDFIAKTETAINTLNHLISLQKIAYKDVKLSLAYLILKKTFLIGIVRFIYQKRKQQILKDLKSNNPNLYLFDFYKLGYFSSLQQSN